MTGDRVQLKDLKKIAIGMACYKPDPDTFREQLSSIKSQSFRNWVCVVTFDSDLSELRAVPHLAEFFSDPQFHFFQNPERRGVLRNFETSLHHALQVAPDFDAFAFADQDDIWYPEKLAKSADLLSSRPPLSAVHTNSRLIFTREGHTKESTMDSWSAEQRGTTLVNLAQLTVRNVAAGASMLMDGDLARKYQNIPENFTEYDWWFACAASAHGGLYAVEGPQYDYRQHGANVLGISPYTGIFKLKSRDTDVRWVNRLEETFRLVSLRYQLLMNAGFSYSWWDRLAFSPHFYDAGLGLLLKGLMALPIDKPLARACWVRAVGKNIYFWRRLSRRQSVPTHQ